MSNRLGIAKGQYLGEWKLEQWLGAGGNGEVWLASGPKEEEAAIKIFTGIGDRSKRKAYERFRSEVIVLKKNSDIEGILKVLDEYTPEDPTGGMPWYVMPLAQPLDAFLNDKSLEDIVKAVLRVGAILVQLHQRGISHRDIKPANILERGGKLYLADFGLAEFPEKADLTSSGERLGARWTLAPEMERDSKGADGRPADVYSLAKTLWILVTGRKHGFEGQYDPDSVNGLRHFELKEPDEPHVYHIRPVLAYVKPLDSLLRESTDHDPPRRPSMAQFTERLGSWLNTYKNFRKRNPLQWKDVQDALFPTAMPQRAIWEDIDDIVKVLNYLCTVNNLHHMLLPDTGGVDIDEVAKGPEPETIELRYDEQVVYLVRPKRLIFESLCYDWQWNYFRLETGGLDQTGIGSSDGLRELLVEVGPQEYVSEAEWDADRDGPRRYPARSRRVRRYCGGAFLFVQKTSSYNHSSHTYLGLHNQMGTDGFRMYMLRVVRAVRGMHESNVVVQLCAEKGVAIETLAERYADKLFQQKASEKLGIEMDDIAWEQDNDLDDLEHRED